MLVRTASAPGKIILSGEYAVVFGHSGVAVPSSLGMTVTYEEGQSQNDPHIIWEGIPCDECWHIHMLHIIHECEHVAGRSFRGTYTVCNRLPLGKGMGSSTTLLVATTRCLLGKNAEDETRAIEDMLNPGNSGIDFTVIWHGKPVHFRRGERPEFIAMPLDFLREGFLLDTGMPSEPTTALVTWMTERSRSGDAQLTAAFEIIATCTKHLLDGKSPYAVFREHHRAQTYLGVVPEDVQNLIERIEELGGAAKVIGAGSRSAGAGIVLAIHPEPDLLEDSIPLAYPAMKL